MQGHGDPLFAAATTHGAFPGGAGAHEAKAQGLSATPPGPSAFHQAFTAPASAPMPAPAPASSFFGQPQPQPPQQHWGGPPHHHHHHHQARAAGAHKRKKAGSDAVRLVSEGMKRCRITMSPGELRLRKDLDELRGWVIVEEAPQQANNTNSPAPMAGHDAAAAAAGAAGIEPPSSSSLQQQYQYGAMGMAGAGGEAAEPIRVRRTADPLVLHVVFGYDGSGSGSTGSGALGPRAFTVRVPRFYPHSAPTVTALPTTDAPTLRPSLHVQAGDRQVVHPLLDRDWSGVFSLRDVLLALRDVRLARPATHPPHHLNQHHQQQQQQQQQQQPTANSMCLAASPSSVAMQPDFGPFASGKPRSASRGSNDGVAEANGLPLPLSLSGSGGGNGGGCVQPMPHPALSSIYMRGHYAGGGEEGEEEEEEEERGGESSGGTEAAAEEEEDVARLGFLARRGGGGGFGGGEGGDSSDESMNVC